MDYRVKELTKKAGMTLEELANSLGYTRQNLTKTLANNPTIGTLEKIAKALGVDVVELFAPKNDFIAFVRSEGKTHTITSKEELKEFADSINAPKMCQEEAQETKTEASETPNK